MIPKRPALVEYVGRLSARDAFKRAAERDEAGKEEVKPGRIAHTNYASD